MQKISLSLLLLAAGCAAAPPAKPQRFAARARAAKTTTSTSSAKAAASSHSTSIASWRRRGETRATSSSPPTASRERSSWPPPVREATRKLRWLVFSRLGLPPRRTHAAFRRLLETLEPTAKTLPGGLDVATAIFARDGYAYQAEFVKLAKQAYRTDFRSVDFRSTTEATRKINAWFSKKTRGRFDNFLSPSALRPNTSLILANAIYFDAKWYAPFKPRNTHPRPFHLPGGATAKVPTMAMGIGVPYTEDEHMQAIELPYQQTRLWMVIVLPRSAAHQRALERSIDEKWLESRLAAMKTREVELSLPKFTFRDRHELAGDLRDMGMVLPQSTAADFSGLGAAKGHPFALSSVFHSAFVKIDERGTEIAAATAGQGIVVAAGPQPPPPVVFRVDRSFLFFIRDDKTKTVLFMGRVADPR